MYFKYHHIINFFTTFVLEVIKSEIGNAGLKVKRELESVVPFTTSTLDCQKHVTPKLESDIPFTNEMLNVLGIFICYVSSTSNSSYHLSNFKVFFIGDNRKTVKEELIEMTGKYSHMQILFKR